MAALVALVVARGDRFSACLHIVEVVTAVSGAVVRRSRGKGTSNYDSNVAAYGPGTYVVVATAQIGGTGAKLVGAIVEPVRAARATGRLDTFNGNGRQVFGSTSF